jgi:glycosidase
MPPRVLPPIRWVPFLLALPLLTAVRCDSDCIGDDCDEVPDVPWDPGMDTGDDPYGYGDPDDTGDPLIDTDEPPVEIVSVRDCNVRVRHAKPDGVTTLQVSGEFNGWTPVDMVGPDEDGFHYADLGEIAPGEYAYKLVEDGSYEGNPPANVYTKWLDGSENRNLRVGDCTVPLLQTVSAHASSSGRLTATVQFASAEDETPIDSSNLTVTVGDQLVTPTVDVGSGEIEIEVSGLTAGKHSVKIWAWDESGRAAENNPLWIPLWVEDEAWDWNDALIYFAFTDRFRNGDWGSADAYDPIHGLAECSNWNGGDFLGIIHALDEGYFQELGVNTIWITPVYENPEGSYIGLDGHNWFSGYHGYWPTEPDGIEERLGDWGEGYYTPAEDRLAELIAKAHEQGIRVLFDLVLNHVHEDHVYVQEHPDWFGGGCICGDPGCDWDERAIDCWFIDYLPDLDYTNHDITMRVLDDTMALIRDYDVDAVRVDAAKHMNHVSMRSLRMRLQDEVERGGGAEIYTVGETFTSDRGTIMNYVADYELHGQFDFPLYYSIRSAFVNGGSFSDLENSVQASASAYGDAIMSPFLGNHDIERFSSAFTGAGGDCWSGWTEDPMADGGSTVTQWDLINHLSMAFAFTLTQPGAPLIYYGDEIGLHGWGDPDNRRMMSFDPYLSANQQELHDRVAAIGQARADHRALRRGDRVQLWVDDSFYAYARDNGGGEVAIVAMNKSGDGRSETVSVSGTSLADGTLTDVFSGATFSVSGGSVSIGLDSMQYAILVP